MENNRQHEDRDREPRTVWVALGFLAVIGFFLFSEHRAHALGVLPYLLLLACPLMHLFMHHGHRHDHPRGDAKEERK